MTECPCQVKRYKKNGIICGAVRCRTHIVYTESMLSQAFLQSLSSLSSKCVAFLSSWIQSGALSYAAVASLLHHNGRVLTPVSLLQVLKYVYTSSVLVAAATRLRCSVTDLPVFFFQCYALDTHPTRLLALRRLQQRWRAFKKTRPSSYTNTEDPFTMESIETMSPHLRLDYEDAKGHCYAFHAPSLHYFINTHGNWNPFTREPIPDDAIKRLNTIVTRLAPEDVPDFTVVWRTPRDAFSDVLHDYERFGFYTDIQWFLNLNPQNIIHVYFLLSINPFIAPLYFQFIPLENSILEDPENGAAFHLAKEMQRLIRDPIELKFYIVCNLFVALSKVSRAIHNGLPTWVQMVGNAIEHD